MLVVGDLERVMVQVMDLFGSLEEVHMSGFEVQHTQHKPLESLPSRIWYDEEGQDGKDM